MSIKINKGFSLIELAIVLALSGLLLGTLVSGYTSYRENSLYSGNVEKIKTIKEAIIGFAIASRWDGAPGGNIARLPCPDIVNNDGIEDFATAANLTCAANFGNLPYATLGLLDAAVDSYGNPFFYRVDGQYADRDIAGAPTVGANAPVTCAAANITIQASSSFQLCSLGNITILDGAVGGNNLALGVPFVVMSRGANGATLSAALAVDRVDEVENSLNPQLNAGAGIPADATESRFVYRRISSNLTVNNFDDALIWATQYELNNRMLEAQILP